MDPTPELVALLRRKTAERVKDRDADPDGSLTTNYSDDDMEQFLVDASSIEEAAYTVWVEKAGLYLEGKAIVVETSIGSEKLKLASAIDRHKYAVAMADFYASLIPDADDSVTSVVMEAAPDPALFVDEEIPYTDISRLIGY